MQETTRLVRFLLVSSLDSSDFFVALDEDMFRSLAQIQAVISGDAASASPVMGTHDLFGAPPSLSKAAGGQSLYSAVFKADECKLTPENIFTVVVDPAATRRTIAKTHVDQPENIIDCLATL